MRPRYTYGDSELAGDRLELVARLFEPTSAAFLARRSPSLRPWRWTLAVGPG